MHYKKAKYDASILLMNQIIKFSPIILGFVVVLQAGLNKKIAAQWGLSAAVLLNAVVFAILAFAVYALGLWKTEATVSARSISWWYLIPVILGCILVFGGPWAISKWGALLTFILVITAQLLASLLWDIYVENIPVTTLRLAGVGITWVGALLVCNS